MNGSLTERVLKTLKERRDKVLNGKVNGIPFPFPRFREDVPAIEPYYYIITGATKSGKTKLASYLFVYYPIIYAFRHPDQIRIRILYYPQEETPEQIMTKFMSYLLYTLSKGKYRISPVNLTSTDGNNPVPKEVLEILRSKEYEELLSFFESHVTFCNAGNPTSVLNTCKKYAEEHGTVHKKNIDYSDEMADLKENDDDFGWYEPDDPDEVKIIFYDHSSLTPREKGQSLRDAMGKLSENFVLLRNRYGYTVANIQQQAMFETLEAYKMEMLKPSITNLADNKAVSRDCDVCLSVFSPFKYGLSKWAIGKEIYDISILKDNIRFMECLLNRHGNSNGILPLYFDGACNYFSQMPLASNVAEMTKVYNQINRIRNNKTGIMFLCLTKYHKQNGKNYFTDTKKTSRDL